MSVLIPVIILSYYDIKKDCLEKEAIKSLNIIVNNAGSYLELHEYYASFEEIEPYDNKTPDNLINKNWIYDMVVKNGVTPYEGVYRCFNIKSSRHPVIFAKYAKKRGFSTDEEPALFYGLISPYRIRYYTPDVVNPSRDLQSVYPNFIQGFIWNFDAQKRNDLINTFFHRSLNEYYEISAIQGGEEMWHGNKLYYESNILPECSYEYETRNYGSFDITYCFSRLCKLGVCEKYVESSILGKSVFEEIHLIKRTKALIRYCCLWLIILCGLFVVFFFGNPSRAKSHR